jgi:AbiJ N-terminal domain 3
MAHPDIFEESNDPTRRITPLRRREIFDYIRLEGGPWWGRLDEIDFLTRVCDLEALPSTDARFKTASGDIWQHRVRRRECLTHRSVGSILRSKNWPDCWLNHRVEPAF